jgi:antitoxin HigA-1
MISGVSVSYGESEMHMKWKSQIIIKRKDMKKKLHSVHPGEVLLEEFLKPMGLSQNRLALSIGVPARRINEIVLQKRSITADTALRLAKFFGTSAEFWLGLQAQYDLDVTAEKLGERLELEVKTYAKAG